MRVLINQQAHLGHHYQYVAHLLPSLIEVADDVVVAVTPGGHSSEQYQTFLAPFQNKVRFEPILPDADPSYALRERWRVHQDLRAAVRQLEPDHVLIPSGDAQATAMAFHTLLGQGAVPGRRPCEVGIHFGFGRAAASTPARVRDRLNLINLALSGARRVHLVNLLFYEQAKSLGSMGRRFVLMPHPITAFRRWTRTEARRQLDLPEDGRYIGLAASLDRRKAIGEFIAAFRTATRATTDRLLLAGWLHPMYQQVIETTHKDLVTQGRLIVMNGFLDQETFQAALSALDVVCTPYPGFAGLSSTLLEGVAAERPILANDFGWSRAIVRRFNLGWTCDVLNHQQFTGAIKLALDRAAEYTETDAIRRLLQFHTPANFGATWVQGIAAARSRTPAFDWDWVEASLPVSETRLY